MNGNFLSLGKKKQNVENLNKINSIINHMKFIDDNLKRLFKSEQVLNDHDSFLLFRGKVSKRIVHYSKLILQYKNKILSSEKLEDDIEEDVKRQYEYHLKNLDNHKRELSIWWHKNKKDYHRLCMSNFLNAKKSNGNVLVSESNETHMTDVNLKDTKKMMIDEINRMKNVRSELLESSQKLRKQDEIFNIFESKLKSSAQLILSLKQKAQNDTRYVWYSFFFFLSVCFYIILRRLGFIRAAITLLFSTLFYLLKLSFGVFHFFNKGNTDKDINTDDAISKSLVKVSYNSEL
ncbi:protein transport protein SEC20, putative [Plasmodium malariae]|uniref:Protein transport protein SEC20, putative n=1 Tax=Plasmodium malariae TaxID=5858 RepID=A0A1C3L2B9_PLAMA|nr:protein transport protein SEC20, putative [Plasmodium malariae]